MWNKFEKTINAGFVFLVQLIGIAFKVVGVMFVTLFEFFGFVVKNVDARGVEQEEEQTYHPHEELSHLTEVDKMDLSDPRVAASDTDL